MIYGKMRNYILGKEIGDGGQGNIYEIDSEHVAKIFKANKVNLKELERKMNCMFNIELPPELRNMVTWPTDLIYDDSGFIGFVMRKMSQKFSFGELTAYCFMDNFQKRNEGYRVFWILALNLARIFHMIHNEGIVIGDANGENIGFSDKGFPILFDCDSFGFNVFPCDSFRPEYVPYFAYRQGIFDKLTEKTDDWALAVHIFELLCNGCHPFACASSAGKAPSIVDNIVSRTCVHFSEIHGLKPPVYAPPLEVIPPKIRKLFERAFIGDEKDVPSAEEWINALNDVCSKGFVKSMCGEHTLPSECATIVKNCPFCKTRNVLQNPKPHTMAAHNTKNHTSLKRLKRRIRSIFDKTNHFLWKALAVANFAVMIWAVFSFLTAGSSGEWTSIAVRTFIFGASVFTFAALNRGHYVIGPIASLTLLAIGHLFPGFTVIGPFYDVLYSAFFVISSVSLLLRWKP